MVVDGTCQHLPEERPNPIRSRSDRTVASEKPAQASRINGAKFDLGRGRSDKPGG